VLYAPVVDVAAFACPANRVHCTLPTHVSGAATIRRAVGTRDQRLTSMRVRGLPGWSGPSLKQGGWAM